MGLLRPLAIGLVTEPAPAARLATLEAGGDLVADDERIGQAARLLERTTAVFIEDAPRIAELTARVCEEIRAGGRSSSPFEILQGAQFWRLPPGNWGSVPRRFEHFAADYRILRIEGKRDHAQALSALGAVAPITMPAGPTR
jgi:hypothetical protein